MQLVVILLIFTMLPGCAMLPKGKTSSAKNTSKPNSRYKLQSDKAPQRHEKVPNINKIPNAKPKPEAKSKIGNPKSYTVFNKQYQVLSSSHNYKERGKASWYGKKFHGYHTSNGEVYDMYGMTAAHKTLPLPTYLKVTNLKNKKSIIVKVNDRGPFHGDRIIDLSYTAAAKLGILQDGTGDVEIEAITTAVPTTKAYLQVGAFAEHEHAKKLADKLRAVAKEHKIIIKKQSLYHVHIGPLNDEIAINDLKKNLINNNFPEPMLVQLSSK